MKVAASALVLSLVTASAALSSTIQGSFWNSNVRFNTVDQAIAFAQANDADATFRSSAIDYPTASNTTRSGSTSLADFLGRTDGQTINGDGNQVLTTSVFRFRGILNLDAGDKRIVVSSDDGFRLFFDGDAVAERVAPRGFNATTEDVIATGPVEFDLYYYENFGRTGVLFQIDGEVVDSDIVSRLAAVPVPASMPLLAGAAALLGFAGARRKRRKS